jgi:anti-sigma factor RsiW
MEIEHLTETEIQDFLDGNLPEREQEIERHLTECADCRCEVAIYERLYLDLADSATASLDLGFADRVAVRLERYPSRHLSGAISDHWKLAVAAVGCLIAATILPGWGWLERIITQMQPLHMNTAAYDKLLAAVRSADLDLGLIAVAGIVLLFLAGLDRLLRHSNRSVT